MASHDNVWWPCFSCHKITHKLSFACRERLFTPAALRCTKRNPLLVSLNEHWPSAKLLVFSHNIQESIQKLRILEHPDNLAVCLFSSTSFRFEGITKEANCAWFSLKHCTILICVHLAHPVWSRHNEAGLYQRGSTLCIVQFRVCFPLAFEKEPPIFPAVVTPLEAGPRRHALPSQQALQTQPAVLTTGAWEAS